MRKIYLSGPFGQLHLRVSEPARPVRRPLLCFHLTPGSGRMYEALGDALDDRLVLAPDTPGYGASDPPPERPTIEDYASAMAEVLRQFRIEQADLLGYHTGSKIALALATLRPAQVGRLVLVAAPDYTEQEEAAQRASLAVEPGPRDDGSHLLDQWNGLVRWRGPGQTTQLLHREFGEQQRAGQRAHWGYAAAFDYPHREHLPRVSREKPTLLLCPEDDLRVPTLRAAALLGEQGEFRDLPGWGHGMVDTRTEDLVSLLRGYLDRDPSGSALPPGEKGEKDEKEQIMIGSVTRTPLETAALMLDSLRDRSLEGVLDCFDPAPDAFVFVEGPRWSTKGGERIRKGWRDYFDAPIALRQWRWTEGPEVHESGDLALVCGSIEYEFEGAGEPRPLPMRMTWVMRRTDGVWRILHEHGSQPLEDPYGTGDWLKA